MLTRGSWPNWRGTLFQEKEIPHVHKYYLLIELDSGLVS